MKAGNDERCTVGGEQDFGHSGKITCCMRRVSVVHGTWSGFERYSKIKTFQEHMVSLNNFRAGNLGNLI